MKERQDKVSTAWERRRRPLNPEKVSASVPWRLRRRLFLTSVHAPSFDLHRRLLPFFPPPPPRCVSLAHLRLAPDGGIHQRRLGNPVRSSWISRSRSRTLHCVSANTEGVCERQRRPSSTGGRAGSASVAHAQECRTGCRQKIPELM